jgi:2-oxopent-4-enoate/cis-2-oxohex-4-enoate hydratase
MMMDEKLITQLGDELHEALIARRTVEPLTSRHPGITVDEAYRVQQRMVSRRLGGGAKVVGKKIGVTSRAVMNMLGVSQPDFGYVLDSMIYSEGQSIPMASLIQPRAEGEIAFILKKDLMGPGVTNAAILAATEGVMTCFEIVDSRIFDWKVKIQDTIADNASCGVMVLGDRLVDPRRVDLNTCGMVIEKNGEVIATGAGAAPMGSPVSAVAWLANTLGRLGIGLRAGEVVLSGSLAALLPIGAGDNLRATIGGIGECCARFV